MATLEQLEAALRAADAAGNTEDAKRLAQAYAQARGAQPQQQVPAQHITPQAPSPEALARANYDAMPWQQRILASAGAEFTSLGRGIAQFATPNDSDIHKRLTAAADADAPFQDAPHGATNIVGRALPALATAPIGGPEIGLGAKLALGAIGGGAYAGAEQTRTGESRGRNAAIGAGLGMFGQVLGYGSGALASRAKTALNPEVRNSIQLAKAAGIPLHLSQVTDSKGLKTVASALNYLPFTGAGKAGQRQGEAFTAAVGRSFGADAPVLTDQVMADARKQLSDKFTSIYKGKHLAVSDAPVRRMVDIERQAMEDLTDEDAGLVSKQFQKIINKAQDGSLTGEQYQALRTSLGNAIDGGKVGRYVKMLRGELDNIAHLGLGQADAAALKKTQGQWANMRMAEDALKQVDGARGVIKPSSLWGLVRKGSTKEMRALAKIGQNVLKDPIPDSGTAARDLVYRGLSVGGGGAGAATALGVLAPAAKLAATGITAGRFLNSRTAAKLLGEGRPTSALAKLMAPSPRLLPLLAPAIAPLTVNVAGGQPATPEEIARDAEIVRQFRAQQGR